MKLLYAGQLSTNDTGKNYPLEEKPLYACAKCSKPIRWMNDPEGSDPAYCWTCLRAYRAVHKLAKSDPVADLSSVQ